MKNLGKSKRQSIKSKRITYLELGIRNIHFLDSTSLAVLNNEMDEWKPKLLKRNIKHGKDLHTGKLQLRYSPNSGIYTSHILCRITQA